MIGIVAAAWVLVLLGGLWRMDGAFGRSFRAWFGVVRFFKFIDHGLHNGFVLFWLAHLGSFLPAILRPVVS